VGYGVSLRSQEARDFWAFGPAAKLVSPLLEDDNVPPLLIADAYYAVIAGSTGLHLHTDSESSFCLIPRDEKGVSFWLALDDALVETGGGLEVCDVPDVDSEVNTSTCEVYSVRRGDVILFARDAPHRTQPWHGKHGLRRALVGRIVASTATLRTESTPSSLVFMNGFDGQYLCRHGLDVGTPLRESACFPSLGPEMMFDTSHDLRLQTVSPLWPLLQYAGGEMFHPLMGSRLSQATALALTLLIELAFAEMCWGVACTNPISALTRNRCRAACAAASLLTHPFVWLWADVIFPTAGSNLRVWTIELIITIFEGFALRQLITRDIGISYACALLISFCMNSASVLVGFALTHALYLIGGHFSVVTSMVSWLLGALLVSRLKECA